MKFSKFIRHGKINYLSTLWHRAKLFSRDWKGPINNSFSPSTGSEEGEKQSFLLEEGPVTWRMGLLSGPEFKLSIAFLVLDYLRAVGKNDVLSLVKFHQRTNLSLDSVCVSSRTTLYVHPLPDAFLKNRVCCSPDTFICLRQGTEYNPCLSWREVKLREAKWLVQWHNCY